MALEDFAKPTDWVEDLDTRWPERLTIKTHVLELLGEAIDSHASAPKVMELGIGDGELLSALHTRFAQPSYTAVDIKPALLDFCRGRIGETARMTFVEQDLSATQWQAIAAGFDIIFSLQSFHDLGGETALDSTYRQCLSRLNANGLLVNADFVEPMPQDDPATPRRFPPQKHIDLLLSMGYASASLSLRAGKLGCIVARTPA